MRQSLLAPRMLTALLGFVLVFLGERWTLAALLFAAARVSMALRFPTRARFLEPLERVLGAKLSP